MIYSEFALVILPFTLIILTLNLVLLFMLLHSFINFINLITRLIINIIITIPRLIKFILMIFKIKKENHTLLKKYVHNSFTSKDICSICLCAF